MERDMSVVWARVYTCGFLALANFHTSHVNVTLSHGINYKSSPMFTNNRYDWKYEESSLC
jgi:hypothetical protein